MWSLWHRGWYQYFINCWSPRILHTQQSLKFIQDVEKNKKDGVCYIFVCGNAFLAREVKGKMPDLYEKDTVTQISTWYNYVIVTVLSWVTLDFLSDQSCLVISTLSGINIHVSMKDTDHTFTSFWCLMWTLTKALGLCLYSCPEWSAWRL